MQLTVKYNTAGTIREIWYRYFATFQLHAIIRQYIPDVHQNSMCNACPTAAVGFLSFQFELNAFKKFQSITYPVICDKNVVTPNHQ